jgi:hypothetical protein
MREKLIEYAETAYIGAEDYEAPANYRNEWQYPDGPFHEREFVEEYFAEHKSPRNVDFPDLGIAFTPEWADARVAASLCSIFLGCHPSGTDPESIGSYCSDLAETYEVVGEDADLPFRSLDDAQWGALLCACLWRLSECMAGLPCCLRASKGRCRNTRKALCRMVASRCLPEIEDPEIARFLREELLELEEPDPDAWLQPLW